VEGWLRDAKLLQYAGAFAARGVGSLAQLHAMPPMAISERAFPCQAHVCTRGISMAYLTGKTLVVGEIGMKTLEERCDSRPVS
jgi:hypothetical protein